MQHLKQETASMMKKIELLEISKRFVAIYFWFVFFFSFLKACIIVFLSSYLKQFLFFVFFCLFLLWTWKWHRKLLGEGLGACSIEELQQIEQQLERSVNCIRARKVSFYTAMHVFWNFQWFYNNVFVFGFNYFLF